MEDGIRPNIDNHFGDLGDPRIDRTKLHDLLDILIIAICAVIAGADNWEDVEEFGKARLEWFRTFLELPNGIPSHDTFTRVFACLRSGSRAVFYADCDPGSAAGVNAGF
jgi:hypothetical protein